MFLFSVPSDVLKESAIFYWFRLFLLLFSFILLHLDLSFCKQLDKFFLKAPPSKYCLALSSNVRLIDRIPDSHNREVRLEYYVNILRSFIKKSLKNFTEWDLDVDTHLGEDREIQGNLIIKHICAEIAEIDQIFNTCEGKTHWPAFAPVHNILLEFKNDLEQNGLRYRNSVIRPNEKLINLVKVYHSCVRTQMIILGYSFPITLPVPVSYSYKVGLLFTCSTTLGEDEYGLDDFNQAQVFLKVLFKKWILHKDKKDKRSFSSILDEIKKNNYLNVKDFYKSLLDSLVSLLEENPDLSLSIFPLLKEVQSRREKETTSQTKTIDPLQRLFKNVLSLYDSNTFDSWFIQFQKVVDLFPKDPKKFQQYFNEGHLIQFMFYREMEKLKIDDFDVVFQFLSQTMDLRESVAHGDTGFHVLMKQVGLPDTSDEFYLMQYISQDTDYPPIFNQDNILAFTFEELHYDFLVWIDVFLMKYDRYKHKILTEEEIPIFFVYELLKNITEVLKGQIALENRKNYKDWKPVFARKIYKILSAFYIVDEKWDYVLSFIEDQLNRMKLVDLEVLNRNGWTLVDWMCLKEVQLLDMSDRNDNDFISFCSSLNSEKLARIWAFNIEKKKVSNAQTISAYFLKNMDRKIERYQTILNRVLDNMDPQYILEHVLSLIDCLHKDNFEQTILVICKYLKNGDGIQWLEADDSFVQKYKDLADRSKGNSEEIDINEMKVDIYLFVFQKCMPYDFFDQIIFFNSFFENHLSGKQLIRVTQLFKEYLHIFPQFNNIVTDNDEPVIHRIFSKLLIHLGSDTEERQKEESLSRIWGLCTEILENGGETGGGEMGAMRSLMHDILILRDNDNLETSIKGLIFFFNHMRTLNVSLDFVDENGHTPFTLVIHSLDELFSDKRVIDTDLKEQDIAHLVFVVLENIITKQEQREKGNQRLLIEALFKINKNKQLSAILYNDREFQFMFKQMRDKGIRASLGDNSHKTIPTIWLDLALLRGFDWEEHLQGQGTDLFIKRFFRMIVTTNMQVSDQGLRFLIEFLPENAHHIKGEVLRDIYAILFRHVLFLAEDSKTDHVMIKDELSKLIVTLEKIGALYADVIPQKFINILPSIQTFLDQLGQGELNGEQRETLLYFYLLLFNKTDVFQLEYFYKNAIKLQSDQEGLENVWYHFFHDIGQHPLTSIRTLFESCADTIDFNLITVSNRPIVHCLFEYMKTDSADTVFAQNVLTLFAQKGLDLHVQNSDGDSLLDLLIRMLLENHSDLGSKIFPLILTLTKTNNGDIHQYDLHLVQGCLETIYTESVKKNDDLEFRINALEYVQNIIFGQEMEALQPHLIDRYMEHLCLICQHFDILSENQHLLKKLIPSIVQSILYWHDGLRAENKEFGENLSKIITILNKSLGGDCLVFMVQYWQSSSNFSVENLITILSSFVQYKTVVHMDSSDKKITTHIAWEKILRDLLQRQDDESTHSILPFIQTVLDRLGSMELDQQQRETFLYFYLLSCNKGDGVLLEYFQKNSVKLQSDPERLEDVWHHFFHDIGRQDLTSIGILFESCADTIDFNQITVSHRPIVHSLFDYMNNEKADPVFAHNVLNLFIKKGLDLNVKNSNDQCLLDLFMNLFIEKNLNGDGDFLNIISRLLKETNPEIAKKWLKTIYETVIKDDKKVIPKHVVSILTIFKDIIQEDFVLWIIKFWQSNNSLSSQDLMDMFHSLDNSSMPLDLKESDQDGMIFFEKILRHLLVKYDEGVFNDFQGFFRVFLQRMDTFILNEKENEVLLFFVLKFIKPLSSLGLQYFKQNEIKLKSNQKGLDDILNGFFHDIREQDSDSIETLFECCSENIDFNTIQVSKNPIVHSLFDYMNNEKADPVFAHNVLNLFIERGLDLNVKNRDGQCLLDLFMSLFLEKKFKIESNFLELIVTISKQTQPEIVKKWFEKICDKLIKENSNIKENSQLIHLAQHMFAMQSISLQNQLFSNKMIFILFMINNGGIPVDEEERGVLENLIKTNVLFFQRQLKEPKYKQLLNFISQLDSVDLVSHDLDGYNLRKESCLKALIFTDALLSFYSTGHGIRFVKGYLIKKLFFVFKKIKIRFYFYYYFTRYKNKNINRKMRAIIKLTDKVGKVIGIEASLKSKTDASA